MLYIMPNYKPSLALRLKANTISALEQCPVFQYGGFWDVFYQPPEESSLRCLFRYLFSNLGIKKKISIISVHGGVANLNNLARQDDSIMVQFSGEMFNVNTEWFDVNLVMAEENINKNIIPIINFATNAHEFDLWHLTMQPRVLYPLSKKDFCAFVVSNGCCTTRNTVMKKLSTYKKVDSSGLYENNVGHLAPHDETEYGDTFLPYLQKYKFTLCFENCKKENYVSEKLLNAYIAGTIPIYWGCSNVLKWFNPNAFLYLEDESEQSMNKLIERIIELDKDDTLYEKMYNEPLIKEIPDIMKLETTRMKIKEVLMKQRPDVF